MSRLSLLVRAEALPLARPFRISRGTKSVADVLVVELARDGVVGRGEGVPYPRYGESVPTAVAAVEGVRDVLEAGADRAAVLACLPPGAARNAVDCALWDLAARSAGRSVADLLGAPAPGPMATAMTVGLDHPDRMAAAAAALAAMPLLKVKVDATDPAAMVRAVRAAAPDAALIVDPNESWTRPLLDRMQPVLADARVALLEQPLPADADAALDGYAGAVPLCADESVHGPDDLDRVARRYGVVNVKLDKSGGLTAALALADAAEARGLGLMVGCMICSSLSIAPALHVARRARFVDLDGAFWLKADRPGGVGGAAAGLVTPPAAGFWG